MGIIEFLLFIYLVGHPEIGKPIVAQPKTPPPVNRTISVAVQEPPYATPAPSMTDLINNERAKEGLKALTPNVKLYTSAKAKCDDMLNRDYWAHVAPDGTEPWKFILDAGYQYRYGGENLARDFSSDAGAIKSLMASPTHRQNIMWDRYTEIGIAYCSGDLGGVQTSLIVQHFGRQQ